MSLFDNFVYKNEFAPPLQTKTALWINLTGGGGGRGSRHTVKNVYQTPRWTMVVQNQTSWVLESSYPRDV
jgi:hypothetical protein